jgi:hypothetical protein
MEGGSKNLTAENDLTAENAENTKRRSHETTDYRTTDEGRRTEGTGDSHALRLSRSHQQRPKGCKPAM